MVCCQCCATGKKTRPEYNDCNKKSEWKSSCCCCQIKGTVLYMYIYICSSTVNWPLTCWAGVLFFSCLFFLSSLTTPYKKWKSYTKRRVLPSKYTLLAYLHVAGAWISMECTGALHMSAYVIMQMTVHAHTTGRPLYGVVFFFPFLGHARYFFMKLFLARYW